MIRSEQPIGIFDSGIGGLTVLKALRERLPNERFVYLGDTARYPYGPKSADTIVRYARECADFLLQQDVKLVIVACNTASSYSLKSLSKTLPVPVIGTIQQATRNALRATKNKKIGVIGTEATIRSQVYTQSLTDSNPEVEVHSAPCPLFVPLVEQGLFDGEIVERVVEYHLGELRSKEIDTLLLGCTHYPLLTETLRSFWDDRIVIVECSDSIAEQVAALLEASSLLHDSGKAETEYFVTDDADRFNKLARLFLERNNVHAKHVELEESTLRKRKIDFAHVA